MEKDQVITKADLEIFRLQLLDDIKKLLPPSLPSSQATAEERRGKGNAQNIARQIGYAACVRETPIFKNRQRSLLQV